LPAQAQTHRWVKNLFTILTDIYTYYVPGPVICGIKAQQVIGAKQRWAHGLHNAVLMVWLPAGHSLQTHLKMVLVHMVEDDTGANATRASRHGIMTKAGK